MDLIKGSDQIDPSSYGSPRSKNAFVDKFAKTDTQAMAQMVKQRQLDKLGGVGALAQSSVS